MAFNSEKRKNVRYDYSSTLDYSLGQYTQVVRRAITVNMSSSGLCLYLYEPLAVGQQIMIRNSVFPLSHNEATIRWIKKGEIGPGIYKAGVAFCSSAPIIE